MTLPLDLTPELFALTAVTLFTALIWIPIILNRLVEMGWWKALKNPEPDIAPRHDWAHRLAHAHRNAVENLVVFAPLAITVSLLGLGNALTHFAVTAYLGARIAHAVIYALGIPLLRTIAFFIGFLAQLALALRILGVV